MIYIDNIIDGYNIIIQMSKCYRCGNYRHKKYECSNSTNQNFKKCYDCETMINDIKIHHTEYRKSRLSKSMIAPVQIEPHQVSPKGVKIKEEISSIIAVEKFKKNKKSEH